MPISFGSASVTALYLGTTSIVSAYLGSTQVFGGASAFTPLSLFSGGSQGIWLDPSDLSTMFSDRAGTTPVTAPGTVVGLRLDKSKGLALGAELVTNGDFATDTDWTKSGSVSWASGAYTVSDVGGTDAYIQQTLPATVAGNTYKVTFTVVSQTTNVRIYIGANVYTITAAGTYSVFLVALTSATYVRFLVNATDSTGVISNISVRELAGNHAVAPTDAARPIYGVEPKGGRRNLLLATDTLATQSLTVTAVAHTLAFTGTGTVTLSGASIAGPLIGTGASDRVSLTFTPTAASLTLTVVGSVTLGQLELGSSATAYQRVTTDYDVTEAGVQTCHYCRYDGFNSSMSTAAIDFTGTDKMSVFAGVRKLSDAAQGAFAELSVNVNTNNGAFIVATGTVSAPGPNYHASSKGTILVGVSSTSSFTSPVSNVLASLFDISGDANTLRIDGTQNATGTGNQGTGNFGNYPLFFGRRNNATVPFNGKDYGIIVVGKAASGTEITDTETWLAAKTSGVTL